MRYSDGMLQFLCHIDGADFYFDPEDPVMPIGVQPPGFFGLLWTNGHAVAGVPKEDIRYAINLSILLR